MNSLSSPESSLVDVSGILNVIIITRSVSMVAAAASTGASPRNESEEKQSFETKRLGT